MKIKGDEYIRLHYILTNISSRDIWQWAMDEKPIEEMLVDVPDEFYDWAIRTYDDLRVKFHTIKNEVENEFWTLINKKEFAQKVKGTKNEHLLFKRLNSHSKMLNDMIWERIYPDYVKPFSNKTIEDDV
jgi:RNA ligase